MNEKHKLRSFFKARESSEHAVELLEKWIIPFSRGMKRAGIDDVIAAFFALNSRKFFWLRAVRDFTLPGKYYVAGNRPVYGLGPRKVPVGKVMLVAVDQAEGTARVEIKLDGKYCNYLLEKFEFETVKDWLEVIE